MAEQKIFFSYARVDSATAIRLATDLKNAGADVWLDQLDITAGSIWDLEIEKALGECDCVLFIASKASVISNNALNEVYYALEERKRVLPVKIDDCKIPFRIQRLHYIDLATNYDSQFKHLLQALKLKAKQTAAPAETIPAQEETKEPTTTADTEENRQQSWQTASKAFEEVQPSHGKQFTPTEEETVEKNKKTEQRQKAQEEAWWQDACSGNTVSSYRDYLEQSQLKTHAGEAEKAIAFIDAKTKQEKENKAWQNTTQADSLDAYHEYLMTYPSGSYVNKAKTAIKILEDDREESLWREAKKANTAASFRSYLNKTSQEKYADEANRRMEELARKKLAEDDFWERTKAENGIAAYRNYLETYVDGKYKEEASGAVKAFETTSQKLGPATEFTNETPVVNTGKEGYGNGSNTETSAQEETRKIDLPLILSLALLLILLIIILVAASMKSNPSKDTSDSNTSSITTKPNASVIFANSFSNGSKNIAQTSVKARV